MNTVRYTMYDTIYHTLYRTIYGKSACESRGQSEVQ